MADDIKLENLAKTISEIKESGGPTDAIYIKILESVMKDSIRHTDMIITNHIAELNITIKKLEDMFQCIFTSIETGNKKVGGKATAVIKVPKAAETNVAAVDTAIKQDLTVAPAVAAPAETPLGIVKPTAKKGRPAKAAAPAAIPTAIQAAVPAAVPAPAIVEAVAPAAEAPKTAFPNKLIWFKAKFTDTLFRNSVLASVQAVDGAIHEKITKTLALPTNAKKTDIEKHKASAAFVWTEVISKVAGMEAIFKQLTASYDEEKAAAK